MFVLPVCWVQDGSEALAGFVSFAGTVRLNTGRGKGKYTDNKETLHLPTL